MSTEQGPVSDPPVQYLSWRYGRIAYTDEGSPTAQPLVCVHGIPGSVRDFRYLQPALGPDVRVIRVDLPGFGDSLPEPQVPRDFGGSADAVLAVCDHLHLRRFALLGHSMGGGTVVVLAGRVPERVTLMVLVASVALRLHRGLGYPPWVFGVLAVLVRWPLIGPLIVKESRKQYGERRFPGADTMDAATLARHFQSIAALDFALLRRLMDAPLPPAIVAWATDDPLVEPDVSQELATALRGCEILQFPEGGHSLAKTQATALGAAISRRLHRLGPP